MAERETAVLGIFNNRTQTEICIDTLWNAGFRSDDMSVLASDRRLARELTAKKHTKTEHPADDAEVGATLGIEIGAGLGLLAGFAVLGIPGLGAFVAAGPILGTLMGAGIGAAGGGLIGALIGWGISEHDAHRYHDQVKAGGILLAVHSDNPGWRDKARDILERNGARDISFTGEELLGMHVGKDPEPAYRV
ncbi:MAG TPA: hypothetical protein VN579_04965 [Bryobacteraceae bacterium]|nr:hypothetical protein [Bryobacteraceae bacterium]